MMTLTPGTRLGPYEITGPLGVGGMGEVYKARDPRLNRPIAIKVLPAAAAADLERRARFEREAQAVAALNHPNIVTIHAVEEADGVPFFTMEYVEGRTLAQMIPPRGLPLDELLRITIPLTDAVGAAHQHGILHRDLKPANVMVTPDGRVKVLDFGLAKLKEVALQPDGGAQATAATTGEGRILGTVAYMSPEQAEGRPLDQRSDVFSLGIVLYEMATGQRPFKGDTSVSVLSAILKDTPGSVTALRPDLPRDLGKILKRALTKDPEHRYQSAKDLRNDLESLKEDLDSGEFARTAAPSAAPGLVARHPRLAAGAVVAVVILVAAGGWWGSRLIAPTPPAARPFAEFTPKQLTTEAISSHAAAVAPDGRYVAYAFVDGGREGLRVRQVETSAAAQVVPPDDVQYYGVTFTPDGNRLYYIAYRRGSGMATLFEVPVLGGTPRWLIDDVDRIVGFAPDGGRFAFVRGIVGKGSAIVVANADGTGERALVTRETPNHFVLADGGWSPDGSRIAAAVYDGTLSRVAVVTVNVATGAVEPLGTARWVAVDSVAWQRDGSALVVDAYDAGAADTDQLWEVTVPEGAVRRITKDTAGYDCVSLAADGRTLVTLRSEWQGTLWVAPAAQPDRIARITSIPNTVWSATIQWTPDGEILYTASVAGNGDLWTVRPDGSDPRQLTTTPSLDTLGFPAPDNRYIVLSSSRDGRIRIWRMDRNGSRQTPLTEGSSDMSPVVSADGKSVYYSAYDQPDHPMYAVPIEGGQPMLLSGSPSPDTSGIWPGVPSGFHPTALSPDGKLLAGTYWDEQQGRTRVAVVPIGGGGVVRKPDIMVPLGSFFGSVFAWAPDGRALTVARTTDGAANLWRQPLDGGAATRLTHYTSAEDIVSHAWSRDGMWLALVRGVAESHVVVMRDVGPD
jgi:eukaryotic-like serine/threonine-protein kinase